MKKFIIGLILFAMILPIISGEVVVFEKYDTTMTYNNGKLLVTKELRLKNIGDNPIIPGEIHFKISRQEKDKEVAPKIDKFSVKDKFGKELETRTIKTDKETDLVFTVWDPLLPDFFYDMTMTYELEFNPKGVLFYQVLLPEEKTTIPIKSAKSTFVLPKKFHVTYAPEGEVSSEEGHPTVVWNTKDKYEVEYSVVPFPRTGLKGAHVFWILIILIFLINLIFRLKKKAQIER